MKKVTLYSQVDYLFEALQMLFWLAENKTGSNTFEEFKKTVLQKNSEDSEHVRNCIALDEKIWSRMTKHYGNRMEQVKELFGEIENQIIPADLVLCSDYLMPADLSGTESVEELRSEYERLTAEEKDICFFTKLTRNVEQENPGQDMSSISDAERVCNIFSYIQSMEVAQGSKLRIQEVYLKRDICFQQAVKMIEETVGILRKYEEEMQQLAAEWGDYWRKIIDAGEFFNKIEGILEVNDSFMQNGFCVMPSFVQSAALWLNVDHHPVPAKKKYMSTCRVGILYTEQFSLSSILKEEPGMDEMLPVWKALGDKSKMDILLFIKDKPAYGSEIAKKFSLTTATVSHHMNKLLQLRLVQADLRDGKVYYQTRKEMLQGLFEKSKELFL